MWAAYFMPLEEGLLYSIVKHIYLSGRDGIRDKSLPGNFLILRIAVLVRIFPPCGNEIDQEGRNSHCNQRENDFSERNIGQRQCQHRHIRKEIGPGNFPSGYLGDYQRQSIIAAAGSPCRTTRPHPIPMNKPPVIEAISGSEERSGSTGGNDSHTR